MWNAYTHLLAVRYKSLSGVRCPITMRVINTPLAKSISVMRIFSDLSSHRDLVSFCSCEDDIIDMMS